MNQIHDNLPPIQLPLFTVFDGVVLIVFLGGVLFFLQSVWQKEKTPVRKVPTQKPFSPPPFHLQTVLKTLKKEAKQKHWKTFSLLATQALKQICERKFKKPFAFATGREMEEILREQLSQKERENIHRFFALLDPIKFAKSEGQEKMADDILHILRSFS